MPKSKSTVIREYSDKDEDTRLVVIETRVYNYCGQYRPRGVLTYRMERTIRGEFLDPYDFDQGKKTALETFDDELRSYLFF